MTDNTILLWESIIEDVDNLSKKYDPHNMLRIPSKPRNVEQIDIANITRLSNVELGELLSYYSAMYSYLNITHGIIAGKLAAVSGHMKVLMGIEIHKIEISYEGERRPLKTSIEGEAYSGNNVLKDTRMKEIELEAEEKITGAYSLSWKVLYDSTSREITRRQMESRI